MGVNPFVLLVVDVVLTFQNLFTVLVVVLLGDGVVAVCGVSRWWGHGDGFFLAVLLIRMIDATDCDDV